MSSSNPHRIIRLGCLAALIAIGSVVSSDAAVTAQSFWSLLMASALRSTEIAMSILARSLDAAAIVIQAH